MPIRYDMPLYRTPSEWNDLIILAVVVAKAFFLINGAIVPPGNLPREA